MHKKLYKISKTVRNACLNYAFSENCDDLSHYRKKKDLNGMCAIASFVLQLALRDENIKSNVLHGKYNSKPFKTNSDDLWGHCWVETEDNYLIDITISQFIKNRKILLINKNKPHRLSNRFVYGVFKNNIEFDYESWIITMKPTYKIVYNIYDNYLIGNS